MLMKLKKFGKFLVVDPRICHGRLTFKGTRVPVETVLTFLAQGETIDQILADWPELKRAAVVEAIELAKTALVKRLGNPMKPAQRANLFWMTS
jgi:uncharacterized protein (DUF433 family)